MNSARAYPVISAVLPTYNRAELLLTALEQLAAQTISMDDFEVVVVDDGSTDSTTELCQRMASSLPLRYFRLDHAGTAAAKNLGIFASRGALVLILDDDDYPSPDLLRVHIQTHQRHPEEWIAVLGYTTWAPTLTVSELMRYVTDVGQYLFAYRDLKHGQMLDYMHFWAGRISLKRTFLTKNGVFNQDMFWPSYEDVELGYRLSRHGLRIAFSRDAVSYMNRPLTYDAFCRRCEAQGASQWLLTNIHHESILDGFSRIASPDETWQRLQSELQNQVSRVGEIERVLHEEQNLSTKELLQGELHKLYRETFHAFRVKGYVEASRARTDGVRIEELSLHGN